MTAPDPRAYDYPGVSGAQRAHEVAQATDPTHDRSSCRCCCLTCEPGDAHVTVVVPDLARDDDVIS